jgi:hypothetical protein
VNAPAIQQWLDLDPETHLSVLHAHIREDSRTGVYFLNYDSFGGFSPLGTFPKAIALEVAAQGAERYDGFYVAQQASRLHAAHTVANVSFLGSCYVDLDTYNTEYAGQDAYTVMSAIQSAHPDLPMPSIAGSSGRGLYMIWTFTEGKPKSFLPHWQQIEDSLVEALKPFGADPCARDAARVLRVSHSLNHKSGTRVDLHQVGHPVSYERLQRWSNAYIKANRPARRVAGSAPQKALATVATLPTKNGYTLNWGRMQDYRRLAELRGGRFTDYRKRVIFLFYCAASWYCPEVATLEREVEGFIDDCIAEPERYKGGSYGQVLERHAQAQTKQTREWNGKRVDPRYRHRTATIIRELDITVAEQHQMRVTIDKAEKERRRASKRRSQGVRPQAEYVSEVRTKAQERAYRARQMHSEGVRVPLIAEALGVTVRSIYGYLDL